MRERPAYSNPGPVRAQEVLLDSFLQSLGNNEGAVFRDALTSSEFSSEMVEVEIFGRCGARQLYRPANCPGLIRRSAELTFIESFEEFQSVERKKARR